MNAAFTPGCGDLLLHGLPITDEPILPIVDDVVIPLLRAPVPLASIQSDLVS